MRWLCILSFNLLLRISESSDLKFPPGFMFGAATSAYQIEGAWNVSDKGKNIWDHMTHIDPTIIADRSNGDVACNSYYFWRDDIQIAHELGLHFYRFSVSWSRILPTGFPNKISKDGVHYYNKLVDGLLKKGIKPVITLYHFDLPQSLQNLGGWANPLIADWFSDYARVVFNLFANRVKIWLTINEPLFVCDYVYNGENLVPMVEEKEIGPYICNKNVLLAHANAWRIYDNEFKSKYHGMVSIANNPIWLEAKSDKDEDLAELAREFGMGRYSHAIYSEEGGWPPMIEKLMAEYSKKHGHLRSKLPPFTEEERKLIQGAYDFYALNHYTTRLVRPAKTNEVPGPWFLEGSKELNVVLEEDPKWQYSDFKAIAITPEGIRRQMGWIQKKYNNVSILITENGIGSFDYGDYDSVRLKYMQSYLKQILLAIKEDGINVIGYTVWSLMDNFEWMFGYTMKFGLYHVDFNDPLKKRTPRASAYYYSSIIKHHSLDVTYHSHSRKEFKGLPNRAKNTQYSLLMIILSFFIAKLNLR